MNAASTTFTVFNVIKDGNYWQLLSTPSVLKRIIWNFPKGF